MLFNSKEFLFVFLPITLLGFYVLVALGLPKLIRFWLIAASITFYTLWNSQHALLLCALMIVSYGFGQAISKSNNEKTRRLLLGGGVSFNLIVLGWFKYSGFIVSNYELAAGEAVSFIAPLLPLGISFFTFQKIAYLVDQAKRRVSSSDPVDFVLFVTFFPQLIAGPIVHFRQIAPQFNETTWSWKVVNHIPVAATMFAIGLAKKVMLADTIGVYIDPIFSYSNYVGNVDLFTSWIGALGYTAQLYFDFSGYSDMAIGAALFFGIRLPINFLSPYKSTSIIDFWRRWHITLSDFLREYLYIPLGGNQKGTPRLIVNLIIVMLLGGLWHGARWTFVVWGGLHGTYLAINHGWRRLRLRKDRPGSGPLKSFPQQCLPF